jgi:hypothetical protein
LTKILLGSSSAYLRREHILLPLLGHIKALPTKEAAEAATKALLTRRCNRSTANTPGVETTAKALLGRHCTRKGVTKATLLTAKATLLLLRHLVKALATKAATKAALLLLTAEAASHW